VARVTREVDVATAAAMRAAMRAARVGSAGRAAVGWGVAARVAVATWVEGSAAVGAAA
jgi:hypothetical protein